MLKSAIEAVQHFEQREYDLALSALHSSGAFAIHTPAIVVEIRQRAQIHFMFVAQLLLKPLDSRPAELRGLASLLFPLALRACEPLLGLFEFGIDHVFRAARGAPLGPPEPRARLPDEPAAAWL